jgi:Cdc6-like AAA superfamily ATPase
LLNGSATWLLDEPAFRGWISTLTPQILWISGAPGSGKSHLSTFSIQKLLQDGNNVVAYYYFHDNNPDTRSVFKALSAMVFQIARVDEVYCVRAAAACKESVSITDATTSSIWEDLFAAHYGSSSRCRQLYLVFDGIDEAEREDIVDLISLLSVCTQRKLKIQVLLVGRPEMDQMVSTLDTDSVAKIEVSITKNAVDITRYITRTYDRSPTLPKSVAFRQKVVAALLEGSNGMFLWVDLMFDDLSMRSQPKQILSALKVLPKGLNKVYDKILGKIKVDVEEDDERRSLRELLCWVAHSKRPPTLFVLNLVVQFLTEDEMFDVEIAIKKHFSSLIILTKTGAALLDEILKSDEEEAITSTVYTAGSLELSAIDELGQEQGGTVDSLGGTIKPVTEDEPGVVQAAGGTEHEGDASDEENDLVEKVQGDIVVELRHASLGDYLRNPRAQTTGLIYSVSEARVRIVISTMRIFCQGRQVQPRLWWFALQNWMKQLQDLDDKIVSDNDTKTIVEYLVQVFYGSKELQSHIVGTIRNFGQEHFEFGYNSNPQHPFRVTIHRWFKKALQNSSIVLDNATSEWISEVLEHPMRLLVPLTRICVSEWLQADDDTVWLYSRYRLGLTLLLSVGKL